MRGQAGQLQVMVEHGPIVIGAAGLHQVLRSVPQTCLQSIGLERPYREQGLHCDAKVAGCRERVVHCE